MSVENRRVVERARWLAAHVHGRRQTSRPPEQDMNAIAEAQSVPEFLDRVRTGACFVWGMEMGFRMLGSG